MTETLPAPALPWWHNEDWLASAAAIPLIAAVLLGWAPVAPSLGWSAAADLARVATQATLGAIVAGAVLFVGLSSFVLLPALGRATARFAAGALVLSALAAAAQLAAANTGLKAYGLEYVLFALGLGLAWSHLLPVPGWVRAAARTELFVKVGVVLLGATILVPDLLKAGLPGLAQAVLVIPAVWYACFFLARRLKVDDEFAVMLSAAVSICGVSAAIAACGAIEGDRRKLSYVTSIVLLCAVPMMAAMPGLVHLLGLSEAVGGAWIGGTLDTSGSVAAATELVGKEATRTGVIVKLAQNVLIGLVALLLSTWWSLRGVGGRAVKASVIWERFPKFVLGFVAASLLVSYAVPPELAQSASKPLKFLRELWFAAAFVSIGLETRLGDLVRLGGGRPALAFLGGQAFNVVWTLVLAQLFFG